MVIRRGTLIYDRVLFSISCNVLHKSIVNFEKQGFSHIPL